MKTTFWYSWDNNVCRCSYLGILTVHSYLCLDYDDSRQTITFKIILPTRHQPVQTALATVDRAVSIPEAVFRTTLVFESCSYTLHLIHDESIGKPNGSFKYPWKQRAPTHTQPPTHTNGHLPHSNGTGQIGQIIKLYQSYVYLQVPSKMFYKQNSTLTLWGIVCKQISQTKSQFNHFLIQAVIQQNVEK
jgi:hypothetical protein